ncbi:MAG: Stf0 family sulfotransferase [Phenylobacterium sp.]|uniref:Stf0 family sulfotransferase n=1 Tax=Phenylobacterium sp. TaxID=1871053 RepID=UPI0027199F9B|nr:Stf0 family sulfotransferase [Phenylobacterium sp.]MDO8901388.1 Stf0 family sulfotransferase [Phenylobacterium sp.]
MTAYASYVICTAPRSGSTLLCRLLAETGVAGRPASYFHEPALDAWARRLGVSTGVVAAEREMVEACIQAALARGRSDNGVFGLRLQRPSFEFFFSRLALLYPDRVTERTRFERVFGRTLFIHLSRADKVEQAVSCLKAEQTGLWHVAADGSDVERIGPPREPEYDGEGLRAWVDTMIDYDRGWNAWFARDAITPVAISYDQLSGDPQGALRRILAPLGLDPAAADRVSPSLRKMADDTNRDWAARFRAEAGLA